MRQAPVPHVEIEIAEGKFHQVKRMVAACGKEVVDLERISMGPSNAGSNSSIGRMAEAPYF